MDEFIEYNIKIGRVLHLETIKARNYLLLKK